MHVLDINNLDSSCLYDCPVSIFAGVELWSWEVPVDEGERSSIVGASPLHPDQVTSQDSESSLPNFHHRLRVRLGVSLESVESVWTQHNQQ